MMMPVDGHITSYFGYRYHPILHFTRFHAGLDIGASWGSPIVAAGDGRVVAAGWAGGYGREVQIAHGGGLVSLYGHMSQIVAEPGSFVRQGQVIGYVGSSGLSTGPHVHFEVRMGGTPVNPLGVRFTSAPVVDTHLADAVKARLKALLGVGADQAKRHSQHLNIADAAKPALKLARTRGLGARVGANVQHHHDMQGQAGAPQAKPANDGCPRAQRSHRRRLFLSSKALGNSSAEYFPAVRVVSVTGEEHFSNWKARNAGASVASSDVLVFVDADTLLADGAIAWLSEIFRRKPTAFSTARHPGPSTRVVQGSPEPAEGIPRHSGGPHSGVSAVTTKCSRAMPPALTPTLRTGCR